VPFPGAVGGVKAVFHKPAVKAVKPFVGAASAPASGAFHSPAATGAAVAAGGPPHLGSAPAPPKPRAPATSVRLSDALNNDYDSDDPASFFVAQGISRDQAEQALRESGGDQDRAQMWIMQRIVYPGAAGGPSKAAAAAGAQGAGPGAAAGGASTQKLSPEALAELRYEEEQQAQFERDLHLAQMQSEQAAQVENAARDRQFKADARSDPVGTFAATSVFLQEVMKDGSPLDRQAITAHREQLAELLLLEAYAKKQWGAGPDEYFVDVGRQFVAEADALRRGDLLKRWVSTIGDPSKPGTIYGMAAPGQGPGLPPVLRMGVIDIDEVIVLDD